VQRESSRLEALSAALGQERDDVRAQLALERGLLEDIRRGRHEERSRLLSEVTQVGRRCGRGREGGAQQSLQHRPALAVVGVVGASVMPCA
jgi:hypothetical protein